jgi:hypothetical protein
MTYGFIVIALDIFVMLKGNNMSKDSRRQIFRVIIESPYAGDISRNVAYARKCLRDSLLRGESPIASHLLYTQDGVLDDALPAERSLGIDAGLAWLSVADKHVFYIDYGFSSGMICAYDKSVAMKKDIEFRTIL